MNRTKIALTVLAAAIGLIGCGEKEKPAPKQEAKTEAPPPPRPQGGSRRRRRGLVSRFRSSLGAQSHNQVNVAYNVFVTPTNTPRRGPYCGAPTPTPVPSRIS